MENVLKMPRSYVEVRDDEMEYVEGGLSKAMEGLFHIGVGLLSCYVGVISEIAVSIVSPVLVHINTDTLSGLKKSADTLLDSGVKAVKYGCKTFKEAPFDEYYA